ncbi:MAG TPA: hypothetical protein VIO14_06320 [Dehalococcoidia bacterium]
MTAMARALERRAWDVVALYLLLGVVRAAEALPREAVQDLLDVLGESDAR